MLARLIFLATLALTPAAHAGEGRAVDMTVILLSERGTPWKDPGTRADEADRDCAKCAPLTLGHAIAAALNGSYDDEKNLSFGDRFSRGALAERLKDEKAASLTAAEVTLIERLAAKANFLPSAILQIGRAIDPNMRPETPQ